MKRTSCAGCVHDLGGGCCGISAERECREGGGFELYIGKNGRRRNAGDKVVKGRITPEEIKMALECHAKGGCCHECQFRVRKSGCGGDMARHALGYIRKLEKERAELLEKVQQLTEGGGQHGESHGRSGKA